MAAEDYARKRPFWRQLVDEGCYSTPRDRRTIVLARRFPAWATLLYHIQVVFIVLRTSVRAFFGRFTSERWAAASHDIVTAVERCGGTFEISGLDNWKSTRGPVVFVANHMSTLETLVLAAVIVPFRDLSFVLKQSLLTYPVFGVIVRSVMPIAVGRKNARDDLRTVLAEGTRLLGAGRSVIIFPQATRSTTFDRSQFNSLGVKLAARAKVPAIPLALKTDLLGNGKTIKEFGRVDISRTVHMEFGPSLRVGGNGREQHERIADFVAERVLAWGGSVAGGSGDSVG